MATGKWVCVGWAAGIAILAGGTPRAWPDSLSCGDIVTDDAVLDRDLECTGTALYIGASGVTLDLRGHTVSSLDGEGLGVDITGGYEDVTVKGGTIDGFSEGIRAEGARGLRLEGLTVLGAGVELPTGAIHVLDSSGVEIMNSFISLPMVYEGPHAIRLDSVDGLKVRRVEIEGGFIGVSFFSVDPSDPPTNGSVKDSTLSGNFIGIFFANTSDAKVQGNSITGADQGIRIGFGDIGVRNVRVSGNEIFGNYAGIYGESSIIEGGLLPLENVRIAENDVHDNAVGIWLCRLEDSVISENSVVDSSLAGIRLQDDSTGNRISENEVIRSGRRGIVFFFGCNDNVISENTVLESGGEGIALLQGANTGNIIVENTSLRNLGYDLYHNPLSTPNVWKDNKYVTSYGADIK